VIVAEIVQLARDLTIFLLDENDTDDSDDSADDDHEVASELGESEDQKSD